MVVGTPLRLPSERADKISQVPKAVHNGDSSRAFCRRAWNGDGDPYEREREPGIATCHEEHRNVTPGDGESADTDDVCEDDAPPWDCDMEETLSRAVTVPGIDQADYGSEKPWRSVGSPSETRTNSREKELTPRSEV